MASISSMKMMQGWWSRAYATTTKQKVVRLLDHILVVSRGAKLLSGVGAFPRNPGYGMGQFQSGNNNANYQIPFCYLLRTFSCLAQ